VTNLQNSTPNPQSIGYSSLTSHTFDLVDDKKYVYPKNISLYLIINNQSPELWQNAF
jgi:hypothetical protein